MSSRSGGMRLGTAQAASRERVRNAIRAATQAEARSVSLAHERFSSFATEPGTQTFTKDGTHEGAQFTSDEMRNMRGAVVTHNHPQPRSFSNADIETAYAAQVRQIRAVTPQYIYIMEPPRGGWNANLWNYGDAKARVPRYAESPRLDRARGHADVFSTIRRRVEREYDRRVASGTMTRHEADNAIPHAIWTRFARATGARYRRVARSLTSGLT